MGNSKSTVQGEGDYKSAKKYNKKTKLFVKNNEKKSSKHKDLSQKEIQEGISAQEKAKSRARE